MGRREVAVAHYGQKSQETTWVGQGEESCPDSQDRTSVLQVILVLQAALCHGLPELCESKCLQVFPSKVSQGTETRGSLRLLLGWSNRQMLVPSSSFRFTSFGGSVEAGR